MAGSAIPTRSFTVLTMSRGDAPRLAEWIEYHASIGFDSFHIILDGPDEASRSVIERTCTRHGVQARIDVLPEVGMYLDGVAPLERPGIVRRWRNTHEHEIAASGLPINDPIAWRQYRVLPAVLATYADRFDPRAPSWLALIDVDEFIVLTKWPTIAALVDDDPGAVRFRFPNLNMDTNGRRAKGPILERHTTRWSTEDVRALGKGWDTRCKSLVRWDKCVPLVSVHGVSRGSFSRLSADDARLLHFKYPPMHSPDYTVVDTAARDRLREARRK